MQEEEITSTIPQMVDDVRAGKLPRRNFVKQLTAMGISAAGIAAIIAAASRSLKTKVTTQIHADENAAKNLDLHNKHIANQTHYNTDALQSDYAHNAIVEDSMHDELLVGREAIMARKSMGMAAIPDININITNRIAKSNQVTVEWVATGTHNGDLPGMPASGRSFILRGVTVVVRENGKIVREALYYDFADLQQQIGPGPR
jgi:steroid delta-isomerase-like uncharacterized protein